MKRVALLIFILAALIIFAGCGGGGNNKSGNSTYGEIQGTVVFSSSIQTSSNAVTAETSKVTHFKKIPIKTNQMTYKELTQERLIKLRSGINSNEAVKVVSRLGATIKQKVDGVDDTYIITLNNNTRSLTTLEQAAEVEYLETNLRFQAFAAPNDPYFQAPYYWNYQMINLPSAWDRQKGNPQVVVAVLDTGVSLSHPDLAANLIAGYDCVDNDPLPEDLNGHGTHVAGIISAVSNNGVGIAGVAWNVKIMPVRVLDADGGGYTSDIVEGIHWAVNHGANVINMSLGYQGLSAGSPGTATLMAAIDNAIQHGVTVIAAAGNSNSSVAFPANYAPVIAVAALDQTGTRASYSNFGPEIDLSAPGGGVPNTQNESEWASKTIFSTYLNSDYAYLSGTSMAAPHVAGVAALLYSWGITNPSDVESVLKASVDIVGNPTYYGAGRINANTALNGIAGVAKVFYYKLPDQSTPSSFYQVNSSGSFRINSLSAGDYIICAFIDNDADGLVSEGDFAGISGQITVTVGKVSNINLVLENATGVSSATVQAYFSKLLER